MMDELERKLEEAYQHMKPYIDKEVSPELLSMCRYCERWVGYAHDYEECRSMPCFRNWLGYAYLKWETSCE